jgi:hypothetical protein
MNVEERETPEYQETIAYYQQRLEQRLALLAVEMHLERKGFPRLVGSEPPLRQARRSRGFG